jgi:putative sterol carrier protein
VSLLFGTEEWARALTGEINGSSEYRNAAARWGAGFNGTVLLAFDADAALSSPRYLLLKLREGRCDGAAFVLGPSDPEAGFSLRGPFTLWRDILERRTLAATAILTGKLKVEGDTFTLLKHAGASRALIHCVASLDTSFPPG